MSFLATLLELWRQAKRTSNHLRGPGSLRDTPSTPPEHPNPNRLLGALRLAPHEAVPIEVLPEPHCAVAVVAPPILRQQRVAGLVSKVGTKARVPRAFLWLKDSLQPSNMKPFDVSGSPGLEHVPFQGPERQAPY